VSDVGSYAELPDAVAVKVRPDDHEVDSLAATLELLADDGRVRESMGVAAARYVVREHHVDRTSDAYAAALHEAAGSAGGRPSGAQGGLAIDGHDAAA
jgi:hypothetical protein